MAALPDCAPAFADKGVSPDRLSGMLLGTAIGDALGNTSEGYLPTGRREYIGWIYPDELSRIRLSGIDRTMRRIASSMTDSAMS